MPFSEIHGSNIEGLQDGEQIRRAINAILLDTDGKIERPEDIEAIEAIDNALQDDDASREQLLRLLAKAQELTDNEDTPPTIH